MIPLQKLENMKITRLQLCFLGLFMLVVGCAPSNQELYEEVMAVHDEVMPKMDDLYKLKRALKEKVASDSLEEAEKANLVQAIAKIDSASEGMMGWMREFDPPKEVTEDELRSYLEAEMKKVVKVKQDMLSAIENANALKN